MDLSTRLPISFNITKDKNPAFVYFLKATFFLVSTLNTNIYFCQTQILYATYYRDILQNLQVNVLFDGIEELLSIKFLTLKKL